MTEFYVHIIPFNADEPVARVLGPFPNERNAERAEAGANRNLHHEKFYTRVTETTDDPRKETKTNV